MNDEERRRIGQRLKECRLAAHLSQEEVAARFGVHRQAVSKWEQGKTLPRAAEWYELGPLYGVSLDYLVYGIRTVPVSDCSVIGKIFRQPADPEPEAVLVTAPR